MSLFGAELYVNFFCFLGQLAFISSSVDVISNAKRFKTFLMRITLTLVIPFTQITHRPSLELPGQSPWLQDKLWFAGPGHIWPPLDGAGLLQSRLLCCTPLLQVFEHAVQLPQALHAPSTKMNKDESKLFGRKTTKPKQYTKLDKLLRGLTSITNDLIKFFNLCPIHEVTKSSWPQTWRHDNTTGMRKGDFHLL